MREGRECSNSKLNLGMIPHVRDEGEYAEITMLEKYYCSLCNSGRPHVVGGLIFD